MSKSKVRYDYLMLENIEGLFGLYATAVGKWHEALKSNVDALQSGDWIGPGATAFYQEMNGEVMPSLKRLQSALGDAKQATKKIWQGMKIAEHEAANQLRQTH
jgi:WXG100 family type VII secretion target